MEKKYYMVWTDGTRLFDTAIIWTNKKYGLLTMKGMQQITKELEEKYKCVCIIVNVIELED